MSKLSLNTEALDEAKSEVRNLTIDGNLRRVRQMPPSQKSENEQLESLMLFANKLGLYKAEEVIMNLLND